MDPVSVTASIIAVIQLAGSVVSYLNDVKDASKDRNRMLVELSSVNGLLLGLQDLAERSTPTGAWLEIAESLTVQNGPLVQFKSMLERLAAILQPASTSKKIEVFLTWPFKKKEVADILQAIERYKTLFMLALQKDHIGLSRAIERDLTEIRYGVSILQKSIQRIEDDSIASMRIDILEWMSPFESQKKHLDICARRVPGTGEWLLQSPKFQSWLHGTQLPNALWCQGIPGAGKTVLSALVVEHLKSCFAEENVGVAFFYCDHRDHEFQSSANVIGSLLKQLSRMTPSLPRPITELYDRVGRDRGQVQLKDLEMALSLVCQQFSRTFIVIDALDECDAKMHRNLLLECLTRFDRGTTRVFATSRPYLEDVRRALGSCPQITIEANDSDIRLYLTQKIDQDPDMVDLIDESLKEDIIDKITAGAQGMFLLPALQLQTVTEQTSRAEIRRSMNTLPRELNANFEATLGRILKQPQSRSQIAMRTLMWISHARRPLTILEITHALAVNDGDSFLDLENVRPVKYLVDSCLGLVTIDNESSTIRLVHLSLQEYFYQERRILFPQGESSITRICITYLMFNDLRKGPCTDGQELCAWMEQFPYLNYAAHHWGHHARSSISEEIEDIALEFLETPNCLSLVCQVAHIPVPVHTWHGSTCRFPTHVTGLQVAASFGLEKLVKRILAKGGKSSGIDYMDSSQYAALHRAASNGHENVVECLLKAGAKIDLRISNSDTPLYLAVSNGHERVVKLLLEHGADVDALCGWAWTALHEAASRGYEAMVNLLLDHGANIQAQSSRGLLALHRAAGMGHYAVVVLLIHRGSNIDTFTADGWNALNGAAASGQEAVVRLLINKGANIHVLSDDGRTALHKACRGGYDSTVSLLIERGACVMARDKRGRIPLHEAALNGRRTTIRVLLDISEELQAMQLEASDYEGKTARQLSVLVGQHELAKMLLEHESVLKGMGYDQGTALDLALEKGDRITAVRLIMNGSFDIKVRSADGLTSLHCAAMYGYEDIAELLLSRGAEIDAKSNHGWTALHNAARVGSEAVVRKLLKKGASRSACTNDKQTPLHKACQGGNVAVTNLLLEYGAAIQGIDIRGSSPLHEAAEYGNEAVVSLLLQKGANTEARDAEFKSPQYRAIGAGKHAVAEMIRQRRSEMFSGRMFT